MTKSVKTRKALLFILGGNGSQLCCGSNIKCLSSSRSTESTKFVTLLNSNYSILGLEVLKYTKIITKITQDDKKHQTSKALHYILGGNGWQSCCASNIKCLSCSRKTKSTESHILFNTNCSIPGLRILKYSKKSQKLPKMTKSVKTPKALHHILGGNGWHSCCATNIKCLSCSRKTKSTTSGITFWTLVTQSWDCASSNIPKNYKNYPRWRKASEHKKNHFWYWVGKADSYAVLAISSVCPVAERLDQPHL